MAGFVTREELQMFIASTTDFQISTADFVSHTACIMRTLCNAVLDQGGVFPCKALVVQQQLQLQALVLEVQQLYGKLSCVSYANKTLQEQLLSERQLFSDKSVLVGEADDVRAENAKLKSLCVEKDLMIDELNEKLNQVSRVELADHNDDMLTSTSECEPRSADCSETSSACSSTIVPIVDDDSCHALEEEEIHDYVDEGDQVSISVDSTSNCDSGFIGLVQDCEDAGSSLENCVVDADSVGDKMTSIYTSHSYNHDYSTSFRYEVES